MRDYYARVSAAFDRAADSYSADYAGNPIMAWLADDTYARLCALFPPGAWLLEIGCGSGDMALRLAAAGREIIATDISPAMIEVAERAASGHPARSRVTWRVAAAARLEAVVDRPLDGAYSNFGPLNCEPELGQVAALLAAKLPAGASLLCSVMNRWCAWEIGLGLADCARARRRGGSAEAGAPLACRPPQAKHRASCRSATSLPESSRATSALTSRSALAWAIRC